MTLAVGNKTNYSPPPGQININPKEIAKFDGIAARWWDLDGEFRMLHRINTMRLDYILEHSGGLFGKMVLDVGCGGGILAESIAREGVKVTGLDMGGKSLEVARLHALENGLNLDYRQETVEAHANTHPATYDVVTCMEILEHVPDPASIVHACARLIKPDGHVFFSTLNRTIKGWLIAIVGAEYILGMIPQGTHHINKCIKPSELLSWIDDTPLYERHIIGLHFNMLKNCFYMGGNVDINYILHTCRQV